MDNARPRLQGAILKRLGIRYKFNGSDDDGYDCSGFVWRVYQEIGADFDRAPARTLWGRFPAATGDETRQFGTLVFFNGLSHVGIVRDAETFYHSSRTQGVMVSSFSGYWGKRITGYRRPPFPLAPQPVEQFILGRCDRTQGVLLSQRRALPPIRPRPDPAKTRPVRPRP
jgi:uncharacterized protein YycO